MLICLWWWSLCQTKVWSKINFAKRNLFDLTWSLGLSKLWMLWCLLQCTDSSVLQYQLQDGPKLVWWLCWERKWIVLGRQRIRTSQIYDQPVLRHCPSTRWQICEKAFGREAYSGGNTTGSFCLEAASGVLNAWVEVANSAIYPSRKEPTAAFGCEALVCHQGGWAVCYWNCVRGMAVSSEQRL